MCLVYESGRPLRSSGLSVLAVRQSTTKTSGNAAFSHYALSSWNSLPVDLRGADNIDIFKLGYGFIISIMTYFTPFSFPFHFTVFPPLFFTTSGWQKYLHDKTIWSKHVGYFILMSYHIGVGSSNWGRPCGEESALDELQKRRPGVTEGGNTVL